MYFVNNCYKLCTIRYGCGTDVRVWPNSNLLIYSQHLFENCQLVCVKYLGDLINVVYVSR